MHGNPPLSFPGLLGTVENIMTTFRVEKQRVCRRVEAADAIKYFFRPVDDNLIPEAFRAENLVHQNPHVVTKMVICPHVETAVI